MILRQYLHNNPIAISYFFGCGGQAIGAVVDPVDNADFYMKEAEALGMNIAYVIDTHVHADHVSGARALTEASGAKLILHESALASYLFVPAKDGEKIELGNVTLEVMHTPGHTPEHLSILVTDRTRGADPWFVLTGHTLMVGDVGRTELASSLEEGASLLYDSLFNRLLRLDDHIEVLPGAYAGSVCGRALSGKASSTIGFERKYNKALQAKDKDEFIRFMTADVPPRPEGFEQIRSHNMGESSVPGI